MLAFLLFGFSGCSTLPVSSRPDSPSEKRTPVHLASLTRSQIWTRLYTQFEKWKGTDYRLGGLSQNGIDCSGFVHVTFKDQLGLDLPRSTKGLAVTGKRISFCELAPGDLVLFKTGLFSRHVGIYMDRSRFLHVSKSEGVTLTSLQDAYWGPRLWMARRVVTPGSGG